MPPEILSAPRWMAEFRPCFLGGSSYAVNLNGHTDVALCDSLASAELDAARRNYQAGSYTFPQQFGQCRRRRVGRLVVSKQVWPCFIKRELGT